MAKSTLKSLFSIILAIIAAGVVYFFSWAIIYIIIASAVLGILYYSFKFKDKPSS
jgi:4-hydroxybenzoate polyprenyltransferase